MTTNEGNSGGKPRRNALLKLRPVLRWLVKLRGSSRAIAGGLGLGMFLAFTPTVGLQVVGALFLATVLNLNRPAAVVPVWITNPLTIAPIYTFNYWVGCFFLDGPPVTTVSKAFISMAARLSKLDFYDIPHQVTTFMQLGREIFWPLVVGSLVVGAVAGGLVYWASYRLLELRRRRKLRRKKKSEQVR